MHLERGFLRINPGTNDVAFMVAHNFGLVIIEEGKVDAANKEVHLKSQQISRMSFAKDPEVTGLNRSFKLNAEQCLEITSDMATSKTEMTNHLLVTYKKR
jgi:THAP domain-containing protein 4